MDQKYLKGLLKEIFGPQPVSDSVGVMWGLKIWMLTNSDGADTSERLENYYTSYFNIFRIYWENNPQNYFSVINLPPTK